MPLFLDTWALSNQAISICDRCKQKVPYLALRPDGDKPGLRVCEPCWDEKDRYKLPARQPEKVALDNGRPDSSLTSSGDADWSNA